MTIDSENLLNSIIDSFGRIKNIMPEDIPNIDLYMDQVTTFMDERLKATTRNKGDEKLMTKTMINNYAKNDVIPPPIKKKYNKDHVLILIMVYYFKSILQINDIKDLIDPITTRYFNKESDVSIEDIYNTVFEDKGLQLDAILEDITKDYNASLEKFTDAPDADKDYLQMYSFVCSLACDVFVKKLLIEKIVDSLRLHKASEKEGDNKYNISPDSKKK